ncbi:unnamed protein product [Ectocarpus sp. 12 AP-2014]
MYPSESKEYSAKVYTGAKRKRAHTPRACDCCMLRSVYGAALTVPLSCFCRTASTSAPRPRPLNSEISQHKTLRTPTVFLRFVFLFHELSISPFDFGAFLGNMGGFWGA